MCGIAGIVDLEGVDQPRAERRLDAALDRMRRRGPDGEGKWSDRHCALGHRRLAIVDLSPAGAQPMARDDLVIVFNGMIYNYRALRDELRGLGHRFQTDTDTEVLLAGWRQWRAALLPKLTGMFAFAIWDARARELVLARDRFGKKPLLYRRENGYLAFASELVALQRLEGRRGEIDPAALRLYFALRYLPEPRCILAGVAKLPPGHLAVFSGGNIELARWYDDDARPHGFADEAAAAAELEARLEAAVRDRLVADVPVGAFLSSGRDSAIVAALMAEAATTVRTFTVGFEGAAAYYEERPGARRVAEHLGTTHTEIAVTVDEAPRVLDDVLDGLDEPFADSSAIPTFLVARETAQHVTVALSGDGADEVFGGYRKYQGELYAARYRRLPAWLRRTVARPLARRLPEGKNRPLLDGFRRARRFIAHADKEPAARHAGWARQLDEAELDRLLVEPATADPTVEQLVEALYDATQESDPVNAMLAVDLALVLPGDMLAKVDRMSMAHGLEVRCPFLDHRVVACAAAMPGRFKLAAGEGKRILRRAFQDRLPAEVFARGKKGFEVPLSDWLRGPLSDRVRHAIDPVRLRNEGMLRPELPAEWARDLESGRRDTSWELWSLVVFQDWCERQERRLA